MRSQCFIARDLNVSSRAISMFHRARSQCFIACNLNVSSRAISMFHRARIPNEEGPFLVTRSHRRGRWRAFFWQSFSALLFGSPWALLCLSFGSSVSVLSALLCLSFWHCFGAPFDSPAALLRRSFWLSFRLLCGSPLALLSALLQSSFRHWRGWKHEEHAEHGMVRP